MNMHELLQFGLPAELIRLWNAEESDTLLPLQERAVRKFGLFGKGNLLIQAPTTSGKTFVGEMAAAHAALRRRKAVYLVPLKALAAEKWADFQRKYAPYGLRVLVSSRDHREFDAAFERGEFDLAVVVYEKLAQLLVRRPERIRQLELVIADELEILSDPERGPLVEIVLTRLLDAGVRLVGMSAVLGDADALAEWMQAELLQFDRRPVDLRYGVLHNGEFRYRSYNDLAEASETMVDCPAESPWEVIRENAAVLADRGEPCLIFVKDRYESRFGAQRLADRIDLPAADRALERLRTLEPTHARDLLTDLMTHGVAFHNADLAPEERDVVEQAFRDGEVRILVSTSTLAAGLNLPAQNVFVAADKWQYDARFGTPWKAPILRGEYENMGGRAGRFGAGKPFGRSILVAPTPFDQDTLWQRYVNGDREPTEPQLGRAPLEDHVVRLVASNACRTLGDLVRFLGRTPTGRWVWARTLTPDEIEERIQAAVHRAMDLGMIAVAASGRLEATPLGWTAAVKGVAPATARDLAAWIHESETRDWIPLDPLLAALLTPDGRAVQLALTVREYEHADYPNRLRAEAADAENRGDVPLNRIRDSKAAPFFEEVRAIKGALLLADWIDETPVFDIEERYGVFHGQILAASQQAAWLLDAAAGIAHACGADDALAVRLSELAERVARGSLPAHLPLLRLGRPRLSRRAVIALARERLDTRERLASAAPERLARWLAMDDARALIAWAARACRTASQADARCDAPPAEPRPVLIIDDARPDRIELDGAHIPLQEKQYRLIRLLAQRPGEMRSYAEIYDELWADVVVEPAQIQVQKGELVRRIRAAAPQRADCIRTVPRRGFILDLAPHEVSLRLAAPSPAGAG